VCQLSLAARAALDTKWHDNNIDGHAWGEDALPVSVNSMLCLHSRVQAFGFGIAPEFDLYQKASGCHPIEWHFVKTRFVKTGTI
jgi:hypothetical protein